MNSFWRRLAACERRTEYFLRLITQLKIRIRALEQQLADQRGG
jgi:hypothetical protein